MEQLGINFNLLLFQLSIVALLLVFAIVTLFNLRHRKMEAQSLALWVFIIILIPFLGALAYWIVRPAKENA